MQHIPPKRYFLLNEDSILVEWNPEISAELIPVLKAFKKTILQHIKDDVLAVNSAYSSLLVQYSQPIANFHSKKQKLQALFKELDIETTNLFKVWNVPVCYEPPFSEDLNMLAKLKGISSKQLIDLHTSPEYIVYFMGFLPGFLYLGGLNSILETPRRQTPRLNVKAGSVAIGGSQTGIYPVESPGGWHIIGNTPLSFFQVNKQPPTSIEIGDRIKFEAVSYKAYSDLQDKTVITTYKNNSEK